MDSTINLRIDDSLKLGLEELAGDNNQSLSEYLRELLTNHVLEIEDYSDLEFIDLPETFEISVSEGNQNNEYEKTFDFTYLLTWLFCKYMNPYETNGKQVIVSLKNKVELVLNDSSFSQELKMEFVKVLNDINRFLVEPDSNNKQFVFSVPNHSLSFDYYRLMNEIWSLKY